MSFCVRRDEAFDVDALDIDRAMCGECEKFLHWDSARTADCCGYRYAYWTSKVSVLRTPINPEAGRTGGR